eukprot:scaffold302_cov397-Prasinococcus_capsulatus_cf.AAC.6
MYLHRVSTWTGSGKKVRGAAVAGGLPRPGRRCSASTSCGDGWMDGWMERGREGGTGWAWVRGRRARKLPPSGSEERHPTDPQTAQGAVEGQPGGGGARRAPPERCPRRERQRLHTSSSACVSFPLARPDAARWCSH